MLSMAASVSSDRDTPTIFCIKTFIIVLTLTVMIRSDMNALCYLMTYGSN
jgi:hypothetical protein